MRQLPLTVFVAARKPWSLVEERVRRFLERYKPRWLYVMFSGGMDSSTVLAAARRVTSDIVAVYLHIAGQTHRDNLMAAVEVAKRLGFRVVSLGVARRRALRQMVLRAIEEHGTPLMLHVVTVDYRLGVDYWSAVRVYGLPSPGERWGAGKRWCCVHFKDLWFAELPPNCIVDGRPSRCLAVGIRWQESWYRRRLWSVPAALPVRVFNARDGTVDYAVAPAIDLSDEEVWESLRHYGVYEVVKRQYDLWGAAPNCSVCPLASVERLRRAARRLPGGYVRRVCQVLAAVSGRSGEWARRRIESMLEALGCRA